MINTKIINIVGIVSAQVVQLNVRQQMRRVLSLHINASKVI